MRGRVGGQTGFGAVLGLVLMSLATGAAPAQEFRFFQIGTAAVGDTFFAVGSLISAAISNPPGSRPCDSGGSCGVPGLVAVAVSTGGSLENAKLVTTRQLGSALVQADVAYWAFHGTGPFEGDIGAAGIDLRAIANLYTSQMHVVVREESGLLRIEQLAGKRVSLGELGSGSLVNARTVLAAHGLGEADVEAHFLTPGEASDALYEHTIDAFFLVGGAPVEAIADLASRTAVRLLPIDGTVGEELKSFYPFFRSARIAAGVYPGVGLVQTVGVGNQWIVTADLDEELAYGLTRALWHDNTRAQLVAGHPLGFQVRLESALDRIAIPLHPGAQRYYDEIGLKR